jgi:hypothetical protein
MAKDMASLLSRPAAAIPDQAEAGTDGRDQAGAGSLQGMLGQPQQGQGGPVMGPPAPNYQQTVAAVRHLSEFQRQWKQLLAIPGLGKKDVKGDVMMMMADVMGEGLVTLPQVMNELKAMPADPLGQRQWIEEHYKKAQQAEQMVIQHHTAAFPQIMPGEIETAMAGNSNGDHAGMMGGLADHYRSRSPKGRR